jgi:energy-coupling factor transport system ATP-binding protein
MIAFDSVSFSYPGTGGLEPALFEVSLSVEPGCLLAVLGANGSGKSTLARLCDGLLVPTSGAVTVDGMDTRDATCLWEVRERVGVVLQSPDDQIVGTVVEEDVAFGPENLGVPPPEIRARVDRALSETGLAGLERREPHLLSQGQKQRLAVAGALALSPAYLVLDEPTAMLDQKGRRDVLEVVGRLVAQGTGVVHITHDLAEALSADRVAVLHGGRLAYVGAPDTLLDGTIELESYGLEAPAFSRLVAALRRRGVPVASSARRADEVLEALWR